MKSDKRKSFIVYLDWEKNISKMKPAEKVLLWELLFAVYNDKPLPEIPKSHVVLSVFWDGIIGVISTNRKRYDDKVFKTVSIQSQDSLSTVKKQSLDSKAPTDTDTDTDTEKDIVIDTEKEKEIVDKLKGKYPGIDSLFTGSFGKVDK